MPRRTVQIALVAGTLLLLAAFWTLYGLRLRDGPFVDVKSFWLGARMALVEGVSPYGPAFAERAAATPGGFAHPFVYPPPSVLLLAPLASLSFEAGARLLLAASHLAFLGLAFGLARIAAPEGGRPGATWRGATWWGATWRDARGTGATWWGGRGPGAWDAPDLALLLAVCALIALSQASRITLGHGQINFFVCCGLVWFWAAYLGRASRAAGALGLVAAGLLKPYFGVAFALYLLAPQGRRLIAPTFGLSLLALAATLPLVPLQAWGDWISEDLLQLGAGGDLYLGQIPLTPGENFNLQNVLTDLRAAMAGTTGAAGPSGDAPARAGARAPWILLGLAALQLGAMARLARAGAVQSLPAGALMLLVFLAAPVSWVHYMLYAAVGCGILALCAWRVGPRWLAGGAGLALLLLLQPSALTASATDPARHLPGAAFLLVWAAAILASLTRRLPDPG